MKIFIACSKHFYHKIPEIKNELESQGHQIHLPNSYDAPFKEEEMRKLGRQEHQKWKAEMLGRDKENIEPNDAVLVLNFEKHGQENYIGGATFLEIYKAWELNKKLYLYNPIPENMIKDELLGFNPTIINQDLSTIQEECENKKIQPKKSTDKNPNPRVGVCVLITKNNKILLGKRKGSHGDGTWSTPGGHLEFFEKIKECAIREVKEETDMDIEISEDEIFTITNDFFEKENKHYITLYLKAKTDQEPKNMEPEKCEEWKWFSLDEFPENLFVPIQNLLKQKERSLV